MKEYFCVGTYTEQILFGTGELFEGKGKGIYICEFDEGKISVLQQIDTRNASFLCIDEQRKKIYAVNELKEYHGVFGGGLTEFDYSDGQLKEVMSLETDGTDPCHVEIAPNKEFLSVANFASGSVTVFKLDEKGDLTGEKKLFEHTGRGADSFRQDGPHAHKVIFLENENLMFVADLGIDIVKAYRYEGSNVTPAPEYDIHSMPGGGPRSGEFSADGKYFYLVNELTNKISCYTCENGKFCEFDAISTLPEGVSGAENMCADIHITPDGRFIYVSNRGHNSLCCYEVIDCGKLKFKFRVPCGGKTPRNFALDPTGKWLLVGNQDSDSFSVFSIKENGDLEHFDTTYFPTPVCTRFFIQYG